jgi:hypothetical protein
VDTLNRILSEQLSFLLENPILTALALAGIVIAAAFIFILILRSQRLSERKVVLLLSIAFGLLMLNYFFPGDMVRGDGPLHTARAWLMIDTLSKGELPIWSNRLYFGFPQELFYGPLPYLTLGEIAELLPVDIYTGIK